MPFIKKMVMRGFKSFASETEVNFENAMNVVVGPNGSGKSCHYDTNVLLADGNEIKIGELVEEQIKKSSEAKKLDDGVYVNGDNSIEIISLNKETGKAEKKKVSKFIKREGDLIYKITTRTGKEIKATGCHPVMTFKDGEIRSVLIRDLNKNSVVASPRSIDIKGKPFDNGLSRFLGYIIGDGYISNQRIEFVNNDSEVIEDYKNILKRFNLNYSERKDKGISRIYINDTLFYYKIKDLFIKGHEGSITSEVKKIPDVLLTTGKESISNLLAGLYDTDGSIRKDIAVIEYCTKNRLLAEQIQGLLLRFGIISKIKKRMCCAVNTENKTKRAYYYVYIRGVENMIKFHEAVSLRVEHKRQIIESWKLKSLKPNSNTDLLPQEINSYVKELLSVLGVKYKPLRKKYPSLAAYTENRCLPTRAGVTRIIPIFTDKLLVFEEQFQNIQLNPSCLVDCMHQLNISGQQASVQVGLSPVVIMRDWATERFHPRQENLEKFYCLIKSALEQRIIRAREIIQLLTAISTSDIYWDQVISIEKLERPEYVYDLTIEDNHNFIANNIFVHNSNVTDSICFVLGRLSAKSMRAAKSANLIFAGTSLHKAAPEANVKLVFDNSDKGFPIEKNEIIIERILRHNGQSIYKINSEVKTRNEVLELLSVAGIDPNGYNIILQGEIQSFVKMRPEERRQVIEEVAGISVYEARKEKSLHELEKTDEKLREVGAILRERTAYLRNLEQERQQALKFKHLEETVKKCKAAILSKQIDEKKREIKRIEEEIEKKNKSREKHRAAIQELQNQITAIEQKINEINLHIQKSTGIEQETLYSELTELKENLAGLSVHQENAVRKLEEVKARKLRAEQNINDLELQISELQKKSPLQANKQRELEHKKQIFEELERDKRKFYSLKQELASLKQRTEDKRIQIQRNKNESDFILQEITRLGQDLTHKSVQQAQEILKKKKQEVTESSQKLKELEEKQLALEKNISIFESQIDEHNDIKIQVSKLDICPLCKSKITREHLEHVYSDSDSKISQLSDSLQKNRQELSKSSGEISALKQVVESAKQIISQIEVEFVKLNNIESRTNNLKRLELERKNLESELSEIAKTREKHEEMQNKFKYSEEKYEQTLLEIEQISARTEENIDVELELKTRDLNQTKLNIKQAVRDEEDLAQEIKEKEREIDENSSLLEEKEVQEKKLKERFNEMFDQRTKFQKNLQEINNNLITKQHEIQLQESELNDVKIHRARIDAEKQTIDTDFLAYSGVELISGSIEFLKEKLQKSEDSIRIIGSVNMKALEVYDEIKKEYDSIAEKAAQLENEKLEIMKIIKEIDLKKKKTFMKTLISINELFTRNFMQLYTKGQAFLDLENKEDPFAAGLDIIIKVGKGKYFDVTSLSGGEQTLVALSLIFAIQEHKPYCFYIFDEIDAALDKRNSEKLAALIKKHIKSGQYIIVTHNDALMIESSILYGVTMQDGISRIISLQI
ncbi:MAG: AAA family ATPase [Nanoarchaeota archaeon]|nr:AAA family ATPase [Nanoarchaeota archaeon]MBU4086246.1 AAA family ATPase [Nanoarchaeota archaeon]